MRLKYANVISKNNSYNSYKKKNYKYEVYIDERF